MIGRQFLLRTGPKATLNIFFYSALFLSALFSSCRVLAQSNASEATISSDRRAAIVGRVADTFEQHYVYADVGKQMGDYIKRKLDNGEYDSLTNFEEVISQLTEDLQYISHDQHIRIYPYQGHPAWGDEDSVARRDRELAELRKENFGFANVEILPGNIGYVNISQFYDPRHAAPTAIAAMNFVANCDALIIDLRENGGGYSTMTQLICSYFFEEPTHLVDHHYRDGHSEQEWTSAFVEGARMTDIPIYVLVSHLTFSAGEGFAFCLKNLGRATIIGEKTRGGANPIQYYHFAEDSITVRVPYGRAADPVTGSNWEGKGVEPDIQARAFEEALVVANIEALKRLLSSQPDSGWRYLLRWALEDYENQLKPVVLADRSLSEYVGEYGADRITFERGNLCYHRHNRGKSQIIPMGNDCFRIYDASGYSKYRLQFVRNSSGEITGFYPHDHGGDKYPLMTINKNRKR